MSAEYSTGQFSVLLVDTASLYLKPVSVAKKGKRTHWLTGRRIIYVSVPREPLTKFVQVGPFKASVYHREQKNILREAAADRRNCLQKGQHKTADCPNLLAFHVTVTFIRTYFAVLFRFK